LFNESVNRKNDTLIFSKKSEELKLDNLIQIKIESDRDVYKNAFAVAIPGTDGQKGMGIAAAIGLYCDPGKKLNLFKDINENIVKKANKILDSGRITISYLEKQEKKPHLDIQVTLKYKIKDKVFTSYVRVQDEHDNITIIQINDEKLYEGSRKLETHEREEFPETIEELIEIIKSMSLKEKELVYEGILMNKAVAEKGLKEEYGQNIGKILQILAKKDGTEHSLIMQGRIKSAAAADARMGGCNLPVMSTSGSGNQGITALVPIAVIGELKQINYNKICEAALLSHLITKMTHLYSTHLSALCGCAIKAGIGATAGICYLLNGSVEQIHNAINLLAANITGIICDGAKAGCALKLSTAAGVAIESALMALEGVKIPTDNGIIYSRAEDTIKAIGKISDSMVETDFTILEIIQQKALKNRKN